MYEGPMAETGTGGAGGTAAADEEYMLGKEYKPADAGLQEVAAPQQAGSLLAQKKPNVNDAFSRMHEDPLLLIRQKQMQARESVVKNPLKMNKVKQEVRRPYPRLHPCGHEPQRLGLRHICRTSPRAQRPHPPPPPAPPARALRQIEAQLLREREDKKSRKREKKEAKKARKREKKEAKKSRKRSPSPSLSPSSDEAAPAATSGASSAPGRPSADPSTRQRVDDGGKYGLQSGKRSSYSEAELGPSAELIANAKKVEPARPSKRGRHERPPISEEERKRKLREMQRDADDREVYRDEMIRKEKAASRDDERAQTKAPGGEAAGFIRDMERESIREMDVEDRVKRNRHFQQSGADSNSFMKK